MSFIYRILKKRIGKKREIILGLGSMTEMCCNAFVLMLFDICVCKRIEKLDRIKYIWSECNSVRINVNI